MQKIINRGDLYYADLNDQIVGSEQAGIRPVVILQNNIGNYYSPTVIIAPITSRESTKAQLPTHVYLQSSETRLPKNSIILTEQVRVIDRARLKKFIGVLDIAEVKSVDKALIIALGIKNKEIEINEESLKKIDNKEYLTRKQIASYGIVAKEYLKKAGNIEITNKLFGDYMLTLMDLFKPDEIEKQAEKYNEKSKFYN